MAGISVVSKCPLCKGKGKIIKPLPFGANPKAYVTRAGREEYITCKECNGTGVIGLG